MILTVRAIFTETFTGTGTKNGGCKYFDMMYVDEVKTFFHNCSIHEVKLSEQKDENIPIGSIERQVTFHVFVHLSYPSLLKFFQDRWEESIILRTKTEFNQLNGRLSIYS